MIALLLGCAANDPALVAHRGLGVLPDAEENVPDHLVAALEAGFGAEVDLRVDGDGCAGDPARAATEGCYDLGHTAPNGHTLAELAELVGALPEAPAGPLFLDVVNDPDRAVTLTLLDWLGTVPFGTLPLIVQTSSAESLAMFDALRQEQGAPEVMLGLTSFTNPEFTPPTGADLLVVNLAELPVAPMPLPVAVYGVSTEHAWALAQTASSDVRWVITDLPGRFAGR